MKKKLAILMSTLLIGQSVPVIAMEDNLDNLGEINVRTKISTDINLIKNSNLKIELINGSGEIINTLPLAETVDETGLIDINLNGLKPAKDYVLKISGDNFTTTETQIDLSTHSKQVLMNIGSSILAGDLNNDKEINQLDVNELEKSIVENNSSSDITGDGKVDIEDIVTINRNTGKESEILVYDTTPIKSIIANNIVSSILDNHNFNLAEDESISDLITKEEGLTIKPIDEEKDVTVPIEFKEPQDMSSITMVVDNTSLDNLSFEIVDDEGNRTQVSPEQVQTFSAFGRRAEQVVTINIGKRVPVKEIIVTVKPSKDGYTTIKDVNFIKDIVDETVVEDTSVKNIKAKAGEEDIHLSWTKVPSVKGYRVFYGESKDNLDKTMDVYSTSATLSGLKPEITYYFTVRAVSDMWLGKETDILSATTKLQKAPDAPDYLRATAGDTKVNLSWKATEGADFYTVYMSEGNSGEIKQLPDKITSTSFTVSNLTNDTVYRFYVSASNSKGESAKSHPADATPEKEVIKEPENLPTFNIIPNDKIQGITLSHPHHSVENNFDTNKLIDGNYETHWTAKRWYDTNSITVTFTEPQDMNYLVWVPRLDGQYKESFESYNLKVWTADGQEKTLAQSKPISQRYEGNKYFILDFPRQEDIIKMEIKPIQWAGSPTNISASELRFYTYNDIADRVDSLFEDGARTSLKSSVTEKQIVALQEEVSNIKGYISNRDTIQKELNIALSLIRNNEEALGYIKDNVISIDMNYDNQNFQNSFSNLQPLGISATAGTELTIFANIPEGERVEIIPTQYYEQATSWKGAPLVLQNGRNKIRIPKIGNEHWDRGGSIYLTYSGDKASDIKLQVFGGTKTPYLELQDIKELSDEQIQERINNYITTLDNYAPTITGNKKTNPLNTTEISLPNLLLSVPATQIQEALRNDKSEQLLNSIKAWEDLFDILYKGYGIDNPQDSFQSRQNIRYSKMFSGAFMYAAGNHIGVEWNEMKDLVRGNPIESITDGDLLNNLYGWGIAHEIGHNLDKLGHVEVTNNIYSLLAQTYDGRENDLPSRLELSGVYSPIFKKVTLAKEGQSNDGFIHLGMYWQLHLAYGDNFYGEVNKLVRTNSVAGDTIDEKFMIASSRVAEKDLTEFFSSWGMKLTDTVKSEFAKYPKEERNIQYLSDESRRTSFTGNSNITASPTISSQKNDNGDTVINISISSDESEENLQGYIINKNGVPIDFVIDGNFTETLDSGNFSYTYSVIPVDILGNKSPEVSLDEIKVVNDNIITSGVTKTIIDDNTLKLTLDSLSSVSGIKITPKDGNTLDTDELSNIIVKVLDKEEIATPEETSSSETTTEETSSETTTEETSTEETSTEETSTEETTTEETSTGIQSDSPTEETSSEEISTEETSSEEISSEETSSEETSSEETSSEEISTEETSTEETSSEETSTEETSTEETSTEETSNSHNYITALNTANVTNQSSSPEDSYIAFLNMPDATSDFNRIWTYDTMEVILEGIDTSKYDVDLISYAGDNIEFLDTAFGITDNEYFGIPANTQVIVGKYRGNTSTNEIIIKGKFSVSNGVEGFRPQYEERAINGRILMLDELPENGKITSATSEGIFIFIPDLEAEEELGHSCENVSHLPVEIKAEMSIVDSSGERISSDTKWIQTPTEDSMPTIRFE